MEGIAQDIQEDVKRILKKLKVGEIVAIVLAVIELFGLISFYTGQNMAESRLGMEIEDFEQRYPHLREKSAFNGFDALVLWLDTLFRGPVS